MVKMFAIRDQESQTYSPSPLGFNSVRDAKEALREIASDKTTTIGKHPNDFQLVYIGEYDPREGKMIPLPSNKNICWANDLIITGGEA